MLTDKQLKALKPKSKTYELRDSQTVIGRSSLYLKVTQAGSKIWYAFYYLDRRRKKIKIGSYPQVSLSEARRYCHEISKQLEAGEDPKVIDLSKKIKRKESSEAGTLYDLIIAYTDNMRSEDKTTWLTVKKSLLSYINKYNPDLLKMRANLVTSRHISDFLAFHIGRGVTTQTNRLRSYLMTAFNFAMKSENNPRIQCTQNWHIESNPVNNIPKQADWERSGENTLSLRELKDAWCLEDLTEVMSIESASLIRLCIATAGQRPSMLLRARLENIDLKEGIIEFSKSEVKNKTPHVVPLNDLAIEALAPVVEKARREGRSLLFPNPKNPEVAMHVNGISHACKKFTKARPNHNWTIRDIRRTAKTLLGKAGVSKDNRDRLHGHAMQDVSSKHYDRYDYLKEKRYAVNSWQKIISEQISAAQAKNKAKLI